MKFTRERKRLWLAIAGSIFVHLLVAFSLAAFGRSSAPLPDQEDRPVELTMIDLAATPPPRTVPANPAYLETDPAKESKEEPKEKTFESNANSIAKTEVPASGDLPLPSQQGKDNPFLQVETQDSSLPSQSMQAQPQVTPPPPVATPPPTATPLPTPPATPKPKPSAPPPKPTPLPEPLLTPAPDQLAMLTGTPPPPIRDPNEAESTPPPPKPTANPALLRPRPQRPASNYQPEKNRTRITGGITDRGPSAVNAVGTPLGRYNKIVSDAVGVLWYRYTKERRDLTSVGTAVIEAEVDRAGKVRNLRLISNSANESFANICLQSFQEAQIPPIPEELSATLPDGRLPVTFSFTMYAN